MHAFSQDLRDRVLRAHQEGGTSTQQLAQRFSVSRRWVQKLLREVRQTGLAAPRPHGGGRPPLLTDAHQQQLAERLARQSEATLAELREELGVGLSLVAIWWRVERLNPNRKKKA